MLKTLKQAALRFSDRRALAELRPALEATLEERRALAGLADADLEARARAARGPRDDRMGRDDAFASRCALAAEIARRTIRLDPRPEQVLAAAALHRGAVAELPTGEGKTLAAALAAFVEATAGRSVHVIPPNDYLAARDAEQISPIFGFAGLEVGCARPGQSPVEKRRAYRCEVVYGSGRELGFDHLRDGTRLRAIDRVQRGLDVAILDEVDSLLLDEALLPLVLGGPGRSDGAALFRAAMEAVEALRPDVDFDVDETARGGTRTLTEAGAVLVEARLRDVGALESGTLHDDANADLARVVHQCLRALGMHRDRDYLVTPEGEVLPLDRHTGRALTGRRWGDGLHQAIEAKERVAVSPEHATRAVCSFERFLRSYAKVSGMTGTARGVERELEEVHGLCVYRIPPHRPSVRVDAPDRVFRTEREKLDALADEIERCHRGGAPVLVGVPSEEKAWLVSRLLRARGVAHRTLTAKSHAAEAEIVAAAGAPGAVTVATQVAGRGTDIVLAGDAVRAAGGLRVLGLERHLRRRLDDQLRGRSGRGGDPGSSCFFVSLEDDLLARRADPSVRRAVAALAEEHRAAPTGDPEVPDDVARKLRAWADEAQERVELADADRRATGRKLDGIFDEQRRTVAELRARLLTGRFPLEAPEHARRDGMEGALREAVRPPIANLVDTHVRIGREAGAGATIRPRLLEREVYRLFGCEVTLEGESEPEAAERALVEAVGGSLAAQWRNLRRVVERAVISLRREGEPTPEAFALRVRDALGIALEVPPGDDSLESAAGRARAEIMAELRRRARAERPRRVLRYFRLVYLDALDRAWSNHVADLALLRDDLALRFHVRGDPLVAYKREAYDAFRAMIAGVARVSVARLLAAPPLDRVALEDLEATLREERGATAESPG